MTAADRPSVTDNARAECPFCDRIQRGDYRDDCGVPTVVHFEPLNPVTPGHMLFVPQWHAKHPDADAVAEAMRSAVRHAEERGEDFNLITSSGPAATQTVEHVHVHYVPRRADDGLPLPWTPQQAAGRAEATTATEPTTHLADALAQDIRRIDGDHSMGAGALGEALVMAGWTLPYPTETTTATDEADTGAVARVIHESDLRNGWSGHDRTSDAYIENARALTERFHITERQQ